MDPERMAQQMAGGRGGRPKRRTRSQWKRELVAFYEAHGLQDKVAGVDAALDKWKGREQIMWDKVQKNRPCLAALARPFCAPSGCTSLAALTCCPPLRTPTRYADLIMAKRAESAQEADAKDARASEEEAGADAAFKKEL
eukprot:scaffold128_cov118-Isochrysis_galbana.AAC.6